MRPTLVFTLTLLLIELLDELVDGAKGAALPAIRNDLNLSYDQIGLLLSVPALIGNAIEPALGILADVWRRRVLIGGGGVMFALALLLIAFGYTFPALLLGFVIFYPASGAFVSLSQATLMDRYPTRREQVMARWTLFGSVGNVVGSLVLSAALALAWGWRGVYVAFALLALVLTLSVWTQHQSTPMTDGARDSFRAGLMDALRALRERRIVRWLLLLDLADLMGDVLIGFTALYFADVVGVTEAEAALAVTVLTGASLVGNALVIPLLERVRGLSYLRLSALIVLVLYVALLLAPNVLLKVALLACVGLSASGWYAVLKGQLYATMPGRSGMSMAVASLAGIVGGLVPGVLGFVAAGFGLPLTMALLAIGPLSLLLGLPRGEVKAE